MYRVILALSLIGFPAFAVLLSGCGEQAAEETPDVSGENAMDTLHLAVTDTIGVEMGDSSYVFALLISACYGPDGNILALDGQKCCVSAFSPDGEHLYDIGRHGAGPGEFQFPMSMTPLLDGRLAVADILNRGVSFFDENGEYTGMLSDFAFGPPGSLAPGPDNSLYGEFMAMNMNDDEMEAALNVARWDSLHSPDPAVTYVSYPVAMNVSGGDTEVSRTPEVSFAVDPEGNIFIAEVSDTLLSISGYSPDCDTIFQYSEEWEKVPKSQAEIDAGDLGLSVTMSDAGASASTFRNEDVHPWRNITESIGVDDRGRVWVEMGDGDNPYFRIYDYSGELVAIGILDVEFGMVGAPVFAITPWGMLAYDRDPIDYPKIYLLDVLEG